MRRPAQNLLNAFCAGLFVVFLTASSPAADNSCAVCHKSIVGVNYLEHNFSDWSQSVHAKAGIQCDACHGGNASAANARDAHQGMKSSTDPASPVYFTAVPATCGACHVAEYKAFQKSAHFKELQTSGRGPNCISCHGSMANQILSPRDLELTCNLCHRKPTQAFATMLALNNAGASMKRVKQALDRAREAHLEIAAQEKASAETQALYQRALEDWHTFKMPEVLKTSQEIVKRANTVLNEIRLKEQQNPRER